MTNDALINGKVVTLSEAERIGAENFHKQRVMFAWINGKLTIRDDPNDDRDHQHWLLEDYGISPEEFETMNRGYMLPYRVQLFKGSTFSPMDISDVKFADICELINYTADKYESLVVNVYNGVTVGKVGDLWDPIEVVLTVVTKYYRDIKLKDEFAFKNCISAVVKKRYASTVPLKEGEIVSSK